MNMSSAISSADLARYRATAQQRETTRQANLEAHRERALAVARYAADVLRQEFSAGTVLLFGSLARGGPVILRSDVDLAVSDLASDRFFVAVGRLQSLDAAISVDLVRLEEAPLSLRAAIEREGVAL
ncbi:MAG: nucleotidyltransferase domain-containing protein [Ardenticatenia bacterium]|nr:nucleotidyltransferase domain-containing protein [Ardenticatenia bacterium]